MPEATLTSRPNIPADVAALIDTVRAHLAEEKPQKALEAIRKARLQSPWVQNALGVCQLRLGEIDAAIQSFRGLVLETGGLAVRDDAPTVFKTNFATALFLHDNLAGCLSTLAEVKDPLHPAASRLRRSLDQWKASLTLWQRIQFYLGGQPSRTPTLEGLPGDLE